ncbi:FAD-dependent thymidylate synthase [Bacillus sp. FJAT-29953]|nr:FAD-dependent thymidylate synthase [Bacillus sp. FJAT-29953]
MEREIYSIVANNPEVAAYGMAKYSRSSLSLKQSLLELSEQKAKDFLNTFYFQYGHSSIADLAHIAIAIENISIWAAMIIVDEPLWDGQERSTRYQDFKKTKYYIPEDVTGQYNQIANEMFNKYDDLSNRILNYYTDKYKQPEGMSKESYLRTLKARAFDVGRYWLPLCTKTSLGQITNARTLERQVSRLLTSKLEEVREIANEIRESVVKNEPFNLLLEKNKDFTLSQELDYKLKTGPLLPTLAKYMNKNEFYENSINSLKEVAKNLFRNMVPEKTPGVALYTNVNPLIHACTVLLYNVSNFSYGQVSEVVEKLDKSQKEEILDIAFRYRGRHDSWLRELQSQPLIFDITMDIGSFRDLNRHRKVTKILQNPSFDLGFAVPEVIQSTRFENDYITEMRNHFERIKNTFNSANSENLYLLPLGTLCRSLHQMDIQEAAYIIELRTGSAGHFSYREVAYKMYEELDKKYPEFSKYIRVTNPREVFNPFQR